MLDELVVLVHGEGRAHGLDKHAVEVVAREPVVDGFVQVPQRACAELCVGVRLEVLAFVAALNLVGELSSFTRLIDAVPPLRALDRAGRRDP